MSAQHTHSLDMHIWQFYQEWIKIRQVTQTRW